MRSPSRLDPSLLDVVTAPGATLIAGAHDALSARLAERSGAPAVYLSGSATAASAFGEPDLGLVGMAEMAEQCRRMAAATTVPIMADGDTGHGDQNAVRRTVQAFEGSGVAGITLEDQLWPKRCGYMDGLGVVAAEEMGVRIEAAVAARRDPGFTVVGRTDALGTLGLDVAIAQGRVIEAAGADVLWIVGLQKLSDDELGRVRREFADVPLLVDHSEIPGTAARTADDYGRIGFDAVLFPLSGVLAVTRALAHVYTTMLAKRGWEGYAGLLEDFEEYNRIAGLDDELAFAARFAR